MWLRQQTRQPRFQRRGRPRRWNGLYITLSSSLGYHNYWRLATNRDSWRTFATRFTNALLGKLRIPTGMPRLQAE
eukprot:6087078-Amphidinium_carterae.1